MADKGKGVHFKLEQVENKYFDENLQISSSRVTQWPYFSRLKLNSVLN